MQNRKPRSQKAPQTGHSIFGTILFSLLAVLAVEFLLLTFAVHVTRLGPQLNQNAEDILAMQVDNRSRYLQSIFHDAQELTSLSDTINGLTQQLLDEGEISLSTLDSSSDAAYPLLEAAAPELISTLRIKSVTGVFLILNTHDLDERKQDSLMPAIYLRDLDPDAAPSQRNADLHRPSWCSPSPLPRTTAGLPPSVTGHWETGASFIPLSRPPIKTEPALPPLIMATGPHNPIWYPGTPTRPLPTASP